MIPQIEFMKAFFKNPQRVGTFAQSSQLLAQRVTKYMDEKVRCVIELGAGTGRITEQILKRIPNNSKLLCFEIDEMLIQYLKKKFDDSRLAIINDSAENLEIYLKKYGYKKADYIISALPLTMMPKHKRDFILDTILSHLKKGGKYIQIQYSLNDKKRIKNFFPYQKVRFFLANIPPVFIYVCTKR
ncbi:methyltransferase domain-containing protein [Candidatus Pacearchaeota archaeon]|nr:methyltransferase domain-containing protein [Candidatus Pacearchaeota archaeon]